jgi:hypothetical protein
MFAPQTLIALMTSEPLAVSARAVSSVTALSAAKLTNAKLVQMIVTSMPLVPTPRDLSIVLATLGSPVTVTLVSMSMNAL